MEYSYIQSYLDLEALDKKTKKPDLVSSADLLETISEPVDCETALACTGFGKFNIFILCSLLPTSMSTIFALCLMSFTLPIVKKEIQITEFQAGILNSAVFCGMVSSGFFWGFVSDVIGRQTPFFYGLLFNGIAGLCLSFSQSFLTLFICLFICGAAICGPYSLMFAYISEFFDVSIRDSVIMLSGCFVSFGSFIQPVIAYLIIPHDLEYDLFNLIHIDSWRIFIMVSSIPTLVGAFVVYFLPETPKFLVIRGKEDQALKVLQNMYSMNTGNPKENFPIKKLISVIPHVEQSNTKSFSKALSNSWKQIHPLFSKQYLNTILLIFLLQALTMASLNTVRLLLPTIFASYFNSKDGVNEISICESIQKSIFQNNKMLIDKNNVIDSRVYFNTSIVGFCTFIYFIVAGFLVKVFGKQIIYVVSLIICALCILIFPWSFSIYIVIISCIFISLMSTCVTMVLGCSIQHFPTSLRGLAVNLIMMCGRIGVMIATIISSMFLKHYCITSFIVLAAINIVCALIMLFCIKIITANEDQSYNEINENINLNNDIKINNSKTNLYNSNEFQTNQITENTSSINIEFENNSDDKNNDKNIV